MEIALIEDDEIYADYIRKLLGQYPEYHIKWFESVEKYYDSENGPNDVYIVDYRLPGKSGIDFYEEIKSKLRSKDRLILMSAIDDGAMVLDFIQKGVRDYVIKDEHVIDSLKAILNGNEDYYLFD